MANSICHWELMVNDPARAKQFYRRIFDWKFDEAYPGYTMITTGGVAGGMMARPAQSPMAALNTYFQVDDLADTLRRVVEAGGQVIVPKTEIPPGWFAMFLDLDGIAIGIVETKPGAAGMRGE